MMRFRLLSSLPFRLSPFAFRLCLLDRYLLRRFLVSYLICLVSLLALYTVIDAFSQLDEFTEQTHGWKNVLGNIGVYYLYRLPWFLQILSPILCLLATMSTLAWLERHNELTPILAAGIPMWRVLCPLMAGLLGVIGLSFANREWLIPLCAEQLQCSASDPRGEKGVRVEGGYDSNMVHFEGKYAYADRKMVQFARLTFPPKMLGEVTKVKCTEMFYRPASSTESSGWFLMATDPRHIESLHPALNYVRQGTYFLHSEMSFDRLSRGNRWFYYQPTLSLLRLLGHEDRLQRRSEMVALLHSRLTEPIMPLLLVLLGIPFVLGSSMRNIYFKLGACLVVYGAFQGFQYLGAYLAQYEYLPSALAAWLPILVGGPVAFVRLDSVRT